MSFTTGENFSSFVGTLVNLINLCIPPLLGIALVVFLVGCVRYIARAGNAKGKGKDRDNIIWGLVAMFVLTSVWGILQFLTNSLLDQTSFTRTNPYDVQLPFNNGNKQ